MALLLLKSIIKHYYKKEKKTLSSKKKKKKKKNHKKITNNKQMFEVLPSLVVASDCYNVLNMFKHVFISFEHFTFPISREVIIIINHC